MSSPTFSPDGQWMWNGTEWIPTPPQSQVLPQEAIDQQILSTVATQTGVDPQQLAQAAPYFDQNQDGVLQQAEIQQAAMSVSQTPQSPFPTANPQNYVAQQQVMQQPVMQQPMMQQPVMQQTYVQTGGSQPSILVSYLLWLLLGPLGIHHLYMGRGIGIFILAFITGQGCGLWWLIDLLLIPSSCSKVRGNGMVIVR
ncbi:NINE protein [Euryarchaeota archaeon]|nr:NINE protein [Euryarchaeota archaeon]MDA9156169.1 NINE protein [Candidatus Poseidoniaceae archaeon]MDA8610338.1 NINE protein [Euryarchaeota archaeon]MDA8690451.1 NINE protein [Euryarchaeota archaeon]MDA8701212.1 NINE protein [Euryarchaeota archaeon]